MKMRPITKENHSLIVLLHLMKYHPRRFQDYQLISTKKQEGVNIYDPTQRTITFQVFKNSNSLFCGERVVQLDSEVFMAMSAYISKWKIDNMIFPMNARRLRYLMKKYDIPVCNTNRKIQETDAIASGEAHNIVANRFNHSISTQLSAYLKEKD